MKRERERSKETLEKPNAPIIKKGDEKGNRMIKSGSFLGLTVGRREPAHKSRGAVGVSKKSRSGFNWSLQEKEQRNHKNG